jgi:tRNA G10  N-methylase Trm11
MVIERGHALDPFAGAGTLLTAAEECGMTTRGFEIQDA